jgi:hypothetical protein
LFKDYIALNIQTKFDNNNCKELVCLVILSAKTYKAQESNDRNHLKRYAKKFKKSNSLDKFNNKLSSNKNLALDAK